MTVVRNRVNQVLSLYRENRRGFAKQMVRGQGASLYAKVGSKNILDLLKIGKCSAIAMATTSLWSLFPLNYFHCTQQSNFPQDLSSQYKQHRSFLRFFSY